VRYSQYGEPATHEDSTQGTDFLIKNKITIWGIKRMIYSPLAFVPTNATFKYNINSMSIIKTLKDHSYMFRSLNDNPRGAIWSLLKLLS
jgi:hypothetical protein